MSVPIAASADCSCTLAAAPLDDPPVSRLRIAGLHAVAVFRIFSRDAVGQRMHVRLADDDRALRAQTSRHGGILARYAIALGVKARTQSRGRSRLRQNNP